MDEKPYNTYYVHEGEGEELPSVHNKNQGANHLEELNPFLMQRRKEARHRG
jgi:hypothetical protein